MARRSAVGAVPQNRRELNHGETGKGDPFWGLKPVVGVWPNHGSLPVGGARNGARYWTGTPTLADPTV